MTTNSIIVAIFSVIAIIAGTTGLCFTFHHVIKAWCAVQDARSKIERRLNCLVRLLIEGQQTIATDIKDQPGTLTLDYYDALTEQALTFLVATLLTVERRLSNHITKLSYILEPFFVTLTKKKLPADLRAEYLKTDEPEFDPDEALEAARQKKIQIDKSAGKLHNGVVDDDNSKEMSVNEIERRLVNALRLAAVLVPIGFVTTLAGIVFVVAMLVG